MRWILGVFGILLMLGGGIGALAMSAKDTSVANGHGDRIHNTGLIAEKHDEILLLSAIALGGSILFGVCVIGQEIAAASSRQEKALDDAVEWAVKELAARHDELTRIVHVAAEHFARQKKPVEPSVPIVSAPQPVRPKEQAATKLR